MVDVAVVAFEQGTNKELVHVSATTPLPTAPVGGSAANPNANPVGFAVGQLALTAATRGNLPSNVLVNGVIIKSSPNNQANVLVGGSTVTSTADGSGNGFILEPGASAPFSVTNTNAIYAISTAAAILSFVGN